MVTAFTLREMLPSDGQALAELMENDPVAPTMSMITRFVVNPYEAWSLLKPGMVGVVAEVPGVDGLVGTATVAFDDIQFDGVVLPTAFLENLKVNHAYREQGLGTQLAQWRIATARKRIGDEGVILTGTNPKNTASIATMKKWCKQFVGPITLAPTRSPETEPEPPAGINIQAAEADDLAEISEKSNRFYAGFNVYPPLSPEKMTLLLGQKLPVYHYRVALDAAGNIVAGVMLSNRAQLMFDEFQNVPPPVRQSPGFPPDGRLRLMELAFMWFENLVAAQYLWEAIRWEFRDQVNTYTAGVDLKSVLKDVFPIQPGQMQLEITLAVNAPTLVDEQKPISMIPRG